MSILKLKINGRSYDIICNKDQQDALNLAAVSLNDRIDKTLLSMPKASHDMALIITALMMQDELLDKKEDNIFSSSDISKDSSTDIAEAASMIGFYTKQLEDLALEED